MRRSKFFFPMLFAVCTAFAQGFTVWSIGGEWTSGGRPTSITQDGGGNLVFTNQMGQRSKGHFLNTDTVIATEWQGGLRGSVQEGGTRIRWANGMVWDRSSAGPGGTGTIAINPNTSVSMGSGAGSGALPDKGLGVQWDVSESGWTGTWVRRGSSNIFDASWQKGAATGSSVLTMTQNGNRVHIERRDASSWGGAYVVYDGTIAADGTVRGIGTLPATGATAGFFATIRFDNAPKPVAIAPKPVTNPPGTGTIAINPNTSVSMGSGAGSGALPDKGLGVQWDVSESGWTGTWVRRGSSNIFDASWQKGAATGSSVLTMTQNGNRVHIERRDASSWGGAYVVYDGTIAADGTTVTGSGAVPATGATMPFHATIRFDNAPKPVPVTIAPKPITNPPGTGTIAINPNTSVSMGSGAGSGALPDKGLGVQWDVSESGWTGTWVRRGSSNIFDASWQKGAATGSSVLTMTQNGNRVHIERRDASSWGGAYVVYDGTIAADGTTVTGSGAVPATGATMPFHATIH